MTSVFIVCFIYLLTLTLELTWPIKMVKHSRPTAINRMTDTSIG